MDCMGCECTEKSVKKLEYAIDNLLRKGRHVNDLMKSEKGNVQNYKKKEVEDLKHYAKLVDNNYDSSSTYCSFPPAEYFATNANASPNTKKRTIFNKLTGEEDVIDFDIPSLPTESSIKTSRVPKCIKNQKATVSSSLVTTTTVSETVDSCVVKVKQVVPSSRKQKSPAKPELKKSQSTILKDSYIVDRSLKPENLPSEAVIKQFDGGFDVLYKFLDENRKETMNIGFCVKKGEVQNVRVDGKLIEPLQESPRNT